MKNRRKICSNTICDIPVVILCGGKGTRLGDVSIPKPLMPIGEKPILWHVMKIYAAQGVKRFILCLGYKKEKIERYFQKNHCTNWDVQFVDTGLESSKSHRIEKVKHLIKSEHFFCAYGDDVADVDIARLLKFHRHHGFVATITVVRMISGFGIVEIGKSNTISNFKEKPLLNVWMNGGFMVMNRKIFDYLDEGELEKEVFNKLVQKRNIGACKHYGQWKTMNTLKDNIELTSLWNKGEAFWKIWEE